MTSDETDLDHIGQSFKRAWFSYRPMDFTCWSIQVVAYNRDLNHNVLHYVKPNSPHISGMFNYGGLVKPTNHLYYDIPTPSVLFRSAPYRLHAIRKVSYSTSGLYCCLAVPMSSAQTIVSNSRAYPRVFSMT